ncbi:M56 family metallopeptidase [Dethiothermospora halolimnae]|uniref:M56 family metallopeptidase n=1 Tax=Dethiothermospora halolimnae TaxID=3114390 RepID=UPI003CCBADE1
MVNYEIFLNWILNTSIKVSFIVGVILLFKILFKGKLSIKWHYYIWFLIIIRLIMPYAPESQMSVFNLFTNNKPTPAREEQISTTHQGNNYILYKNKDKTIYQNNNVSNTNEDKFKYNKTFYLFILWVIGVILFGIKMLKSSIKLWKNIKNQRYIPGNNIIKIFESCKRKMNIKRHIGIYHTKKADSPVIFGIVTPSILLPIDIDKELSNKELEYIILHELSHFKRRDIFVSCLISVLQIIHWFNPIIWYGFYKMRQDCEIVCDGLALSYIDKKEYKSYGLTIIRLIENSKHYVKTMGMASMIGYKSQLKRRINMIKIFNKSKYRLSIASIISILFLGIVFLTNPSSANEYGNLDNNPKVDKEESNKEYTIDQLNKAVIINDIDLVKTIIKSGKVDINKKNSKGRYPIEEVLVMNNCEMSRILLKAGANPHVKTSDEKTVYEKVMEQNSFYLKEIFKVYNGERENKTVSKEEYLENMKKDIDEELEEIAEAKREIAEQKRELAQAKMELAEEKKEINKSLVDGEESNEEYTIDQLNKAVFQNDIDLVKTIIESGKVDINKEDSKGRYPIEEVLVMNNCEMSRILLKAGANPHVKTSDGKTVYEKAMEAESWYLRKIFKEYE